MKRPSIHNPRVPSVNRHNQLEQSAFDVSVGSCQHARSSLMTKLPVERQLVNERVTKRKRVEDAPIQRVTRPRLTDNATATRKSVAPASKKNKPVIEPISLDCGDDVPTPLSPIRKTYGRQRPAANHSVQQPIPQASSSQPKQPTVPVQKPTVPVAESVKSRKTPNKTKPVTKVPKQQQALPQATPSGSKQVSATVKREAKASRQPAGACKSCRARHQKCDRAHPVCGRCTKFSIACEYPQAMDSTAPLSVPATTSPRKKQALLPIPATAKDTTNKQDLRERSVTVSPEAPPLNGPTKRRVLTSPSKKSTVTATPTAASTRASRTKKAPNASASPRKQK